MLDALGVPHLVGRSVASSLLGVPRATMDVDILAALRESHVPELVARCSGHSTAEDLILQKLLWYERGGRSSDRQWHDVLGICRVQASALDSSYLTHWADRVGIRQLLDAALSEARLPPGTERGGDT